MALDEHFGAWVLEITKEMLGVHTRKKLLYLDHNFLSKAFRQNPKWLEATRRIEELVELQLLAVPYSRTHEKEARLWVEHRDALLAFIRKLARGHKFEPYYYVERAQILKAFQAFLDGAPSVYTKEERDALSSRVHDWEGRFFITVESPVSEVEVKRERGLKHQALNELVKTLREWAGSTNTFEQDIRLELRESARILIENYTEKMSRLWRGDFSALVSSPINADIVQDMLYILQLKRHLIWSKKSLVSLIRSILLKFHPESCPLDCSVPLRNEFVLVHIQTRLKQSSD